jgi:hypothetical protein
VQVVEDRERAHGHESDSDGLVDVKLVVRDSERSECNDETLWAYFMKRLNTSWMSIAYVCSEFMTVYTRLGKKIQHLSVVYVYVY